MVATIPSKEPEVLYKRIERSPLSIPSKQVLYKSKEQSSLSLSITLLKMLVTTSTF